MTRFKTSIIMKLFLIVCLLHSATASRILAFFPFPSKSHHNVFHPVIESLASRGHEITFLTPNKLSRPFENVKEIMIPNILEELMEGAEEEPNMSYLMLGYMIGQAGVLVGNRFFSMKPVQELIHSNDKYDLVLFETLFLQEPAAAFMHKFNAIGVDLMTIGDTSWYNEMAGLPHNNAYMPDIKNTMTNDMNLIERIENTYCNIVSTLLAYYFQGKYQEITDKYFNYTGSETRPKLSKLMSDKALILTNSHHSLSYPMPKAPHMKEVGGLHIQKNKPLPKDIQNFMDEAKDGVIFFSLGSNFKLSHSSLAHLRNVLKIVFGKLKQKVLLKGDIDGKNMPENVKVSTWYPQHDILAHKNIKLFITHGGYLSMSEAVYHGVPLIGVPLFAEQPKNMKYVETQGFGLELKIYNVTEESLTWAINEILNNSKYRNKAMEKSLIFKDRIMNPLDEAVYWIEYVLKHKNALQPKAAQLPFCVVHNIDTMSIFLVLIYALKIIICKLCTLISRKKIKKD